MAEFGLGEVPLFEVGKVEDRSFFRRLALFADANGGCKTNDDNPNLAVANTALFIEGLGVLANLNKTNTIGGFNIVDV